MKILQDTRSMVMLYELQEEWDVVCSQDTNMRCRTERITNSQSITEPSRRLGRVAFMA